MTETEWRSIGVQQSRGWIHYMIHKPEPHILLFRRPKTEEQAIQRNCLHAHTFTFTFTYTHTLPTYQHQHTACIHISGQIQLTYGAAATATAQLVVAAQLLGRRLLNKTHAHSYTLTSAMLYVVLNTYCPASVFIICIDFFNIQLY